MTDTATLAGPVVRMCEDPDCGTAPRCPQMPADPLILAPLPFPAGWQDESGTTPPVTAAMLGPDALRDRVRERGGLEAVARWLATGSAPDSTGTERMIPPGAEFTVHAWHGEPGAEGIAPIYLAAAYSGPAASRDDLLADMPPWSEDEARARMGPGDLWLYLPGSRWQHRPVRNDHRCHEPGPDGGDTAMCWLCERSWTRCPRGCVLEGDCVSDEHMACHENAGPPPGLSDWWLTTETRAGCPSCGTVSPWLASVGAAQAWCMVHGAECGSWTAERATEWASAQEWRYCDYETCGDSGHLAFRASDGTVSGVASCATEADGLYIVVKVRWDMLSARGRLRLRLTGPSGGVLFNGTLGE